MTALLEKPLERVSPLKAGRSSRIKASTNPVTFTDATGLQPPSAYDLPLGPIMETGTVPIVRARTQAEYQAYLAQSIRFVNDWYDSLGPCGQANTGLGKYIDALNNSHYGYGNIVAGESFLGILFNATMQTSKWDYPEDRKVLVNRDMLDELMDAGADPAEVGAQLLHEGGHLVQGCSRWVPFLNERGPNKIYRADAGSDHPIRKSMEAYLRSLSPSRQRSYIPPGR